MKTKTQILQTLEGQEVSSIQFEGVVGIENGKVIQGGEVLKCTKAQAQELANESFENEFGYRPNSKAFDRAMEDEFGWIKTASVEKLMKELDFTKRQAQKIYNENHSEASQ